MKFLYKIHVCDLEMLFGVRMSVFEVFSLFHLLETLGYLVTVIYTDEQSTRLDLLGSYSAIDTDGLLNCYVSFCLTVICHIW